MSLLDCAIVGGGPAGLTAATYLARFRRDFRLIDAGDSRARWIPLARNFPGFPDGVSGEALLSLMRDQARRYQAVLEAGAVRRLELTPEGFALTLDDDRILAARTVILATGVVENQPGLPHLVEAVKQGVVRICPICDGFETIGRAVGVLGDGDHAAAEALFVRAYSDRVSLVLTEGSVLGEAHRRALADAGVEVIAAPVDRVRLEPDGNIRVVGLSGSGERRFDTLYSAFGTTAQASLAIQCGARQADDGRLVVDDHQQTSVQNLYAAGDLVRGLNQIGVAVGEAALAATAIHNRLPRTLA
jgi:thioredoxin reductase (NADPH)